MSGGSFDGLIGKMYPSGGNLGANNGWQIGRTLASFRFSSRAGNSPDPFSNAVCGTDSLGRFELNKLDHFVFVFDRTSGKINFYRNGSIADVYNCMDLNADFSNDYPLKIGVEREGTFFTSGILDDIRIYNRALNQSEISYLASH